MKKFSQLYETCVTSDVNPGNALSNTGVTNHYTPVQNILTNIKNLYCIQLGVAAAIAEDGVSIKLNCSRFISESAVRNILWQPLYNGVSLYSYIYNQGLTLMKIINIGQYYVVYFSPADIKNAEPGLEADPASAPVKEMYEANIDEAEMSGVMVFEDDDDEELEDLTKKQLNELINSKDKVKAAKQFGAIISAKMELPSDYYWAGVKSKDGDESIALRWKYIKRRPHGKSTESTRSLINIFGTGKDGIWIGDFDKDSMFQLPEDIKKLINNILDFLEAEKTNDPCVFEIKDGKDDTDNSKDKDNDEKTDSDNIEKNKNKDKETDDKSKLNSSEDDNEDDNSRGDTSDNLL